MPILTILSLSLILLGIIQLGRELIAHSNVQETLQADVRIAGVQVGGLNESEAQAKWEDVYLNQPLRLAYNGSPILLSPRTVGFNTNNAAMLAQARLQRSASDDFWNGFLAHLLNQL